MLSAGTPLKTKKGNNKNIDVFDLLELYKDSPYKSKILKVRGKKNDSEKKEYKVFQFGKDTIVEWNEYEAVKNLNIPVVTWGVNIPDGKRRVKAQLSDTDLSQYIYYDIDSYENCTIDEVLRFIQGLPVVAGAWKSLSGEGGGFLVKFDGLTISNFKYNFLYYKGKIEEMFLNLGIHLAGHKASFTIDNLSDYTRVNVMSYDPDLFINRQCMKVHALEDPTLKNKNKIDLTTDNSVPLSVMEGHLGYIYDLAISKDGSINSSENRLAYPFFTAYFGDTNICGIPLDDAYRYLQDNHPEMFESKYNLTNAYQFGEKIYRSYEADHCSFLNQVYIPNGYDLEDYNVPSKYDTKDIKVLLQKVYYDTKFYIKDTTTLKFAYNFAEECKSKGVYYRHVHDFIDKYKFSDLQKEKVQYIYSNPWKLFGAKFVLKTGEDKKKIGDYFKGKEIIGGSGDINEVPQVFQNINFNPDIIEFKDHQRLYVFANMYLSEGIGIDVLYSEIDKFIEDDKIKSSLKVYSSEIYSKFSYRFGIKEKQKEIISEQVQKSTIVPKGKYLSDTDFKLPDHNSIIWADTGIGKTHFLLSSGGKKIILVPTTNLVETISLKYKGISVFYGQKKTNLRSDKIVCTYSSFPTLYFKMKKENINMKTYNLCIDEYHNMCLSNKQFRGEEMNFIINSFNEFKTIQCLTGTNIYNSHPVFNDFKTYRIRKEDVEIKNLYPVSYKNKIKSIHKNCDKSGLNVVLLQNKDYSSKLGDYIKYFTDNGYKKEEIWTINSSEKTLAPYKYMVANESIPEHIKLVITTSLFIEGANISNLNCKTMHFASFVSSYLMEQFANRFRNKVPEKIFYYLNKKKKQENEKVTQFSIKSVIAAQIRVLEEQINNVAVNDSFTFMDRVWERNFSNIYMHHNYLLEKNSKYEIDYISLNSMGVECERKNAIDNIGFLEHKLEDYGWVIHPTIVDIDNLTKNEIAIMKEDRNMRKSETQEKLFGLYETINYIPEEQFIEIYEKKKQKEDLSPDEIWEINLFKKTLVLNQYMEFESSKKIVMDWIESGYSESKFTTLMKKINFHYGIENYNYKIYADPNHPFSKAVYKYYDHVKHNFKDKIFTDKMLVRAFNFIRKQAAGLGYVMNKPKYGLNEVKEIFGHYLKLVDKIDENGEKGTQIAGLNYMNDMKTEFDKIMVFAQKAFDNGTLFTKKQINMLFKDIRKNMPVLGGKSNLEILDEKKSFDMMGLYLELERVGKKGYKVKCIGHTFLDGVKWKVQGDLIHN